MKLEIIKTLIDVLQAMGYKPSHDKDNENINFSSHGFENFKQNEKNIIRDILGDKLREFFYAHDTQYIYYK